MKLRVAILFLVGYVFLDWVSYVHPVLPLGITPWNPPPGLSLFLLLKFGLHYWPLLFLAALGADFIVRGTPAPWPVLVEAAALLTLAYTFAAWALQRRYHLQNRLVTTRDLGVFLAVVGATTLLVAAAYVALFMSVGRVPPMEFLPSMFRRWIGDLNGILVFTPFMLAYFANGSPLPTWKPQGLVEVCVQATAIACAFWVIFGLAAPHEFKFFYLLFLPLIWIAVRWGLRGTTLALVATQLGLIAAVQLGGYHAATFVQFQFLMLALCVTGLVLGAVVTQREFAETELRVKQVALNRALQFASVGEMTSSLAHELNQPMTALSNYLRACQVMVQAPQADKEQLNDALDKAVAEARRAGAVVHRLRDFFRHGGAEFRSFSLPGLLQDIISAVQPRAQQEGIRISLNNRVGQRNLVGDPTQLSVVLHNLLSNAIESIAALQSERRRIWVGIMEQPGHAVITVEDTGAGITPDIKPTMFDAFTTNKPEGMGLGLAISRGLVYAHGGELTAQAGRSGGAKFVLTLPWDATVQNP